MKRILAAWCLCAAVLLMGVRIATLSAENRQRGGQLDQLERWCEARSRTNELLRVENAREEWRLLGQEGPTARDEGTDGGKKRVTP